MRHGETDERIGYRHKSGGEPATNACFADGHAESIRSREFPHASPAAAARSENLGGKFTLFANPARLP